MCSAARSPPPAADPAFDYKYVGTSPLTDALVASTTLLNYTDPRGFAWASGEYRCGMYNHYYPPNALQPDCVGVVLTGTTSTRYTAYGWRTARSRHPDGVNVLFADGSVQFLPDEIDPTIWRSTSMREGNGSSTSIP